MTKQELDIILKLIAEEHHVAPEEIRRQMELAIEDAEANPNPVIRARWEQIPRKGEKLTPEEFLTYVLNVVNRTC